LILFIKIKSLPECRPPHFFRIKHEEVHVLSTRAIIKLIYK